MGLDVSLLTDNYEELAELEAFEEMEDTYQLSRTFCNLLNRRAVIDSGTPELDQIARISNSSVDFLYDMESYVPEWELEELEEYEDDETIAQIKQTNQRVENNLDAVITGLTSLIEALKTVENLEQKIADTSYDTLNIKTYFAQFNTDTGDGYIGNNFGQDLRNILHYATFVKAHGAKTLFFDFG